VHASRDRAKAGLRIAHVVRSDSFAGVERYISTVAPALAARGHRVVVIGGDPVPMRRHLRGVEHQPGGTALRAATALLAQPFDVIHAHMTAAEGAAVTVGFLRRTPVVATLHFAARRGRSRIGSLAAPVIRHRLGAQIAISDYVARESAEDCVVIHNAVPCAEPVAATGRSVLVLQRLENEKRTDLAIRAWAKLPHAHDGWTLVIAGEGSQRVALERLATETCPPGSVRFLGRVADPASVRAVARCQLATCPIDGFGLSVAEAMACGLPVLAVRGGGHEELLAGFDDLLAEPDEDSIASRLRILVDGPTDELGERLMLAQQARFGLESHIDSLERTYAGVVR
jgi:glycosyltransferase involved in cell wall biosynthesis